MNDVTEPADMRPQIREWLEEGKAKRATHLLVVRDSFSYEHYPIYVLPDQNVFLVADEHRTEPARMRKLVEVYSYALPFEPQLTERRAHHYELSEPPPTSVNFNLETLSRLSTWAGRLERLLAMRGSLLLHPHWRSAVLTCISELEALDGPLRATPHE